MNIHTPRFEALHVTPFVIGIAGGSGSGKSTVVQRITAIVGAENAAVIEQDGYYLDQSHLPLAQRERTNYDHPQAFDWALMRSQVHALCQGRSVYIPQYDFSQHTRKTTSVLMQPARVLMVEGLFALYDADLREHMSLCIYVDTDADIRFIRRMLRDLKERGRSLQSIVAQYEASVRPMHDRFVEPSKRFADVILPSGANAPAIDMLSTKIQSLLASA